MDVFHVPVELRLEENWNAGLGTFTASQGILVGERLINLSILLVNLHELLNLLVLLLLSWLMHDARRNPMQVSQLGKSKVLWKAQENTDFIGEVLLIWFEV